MAEGRRKRQRLSGNNPDGTPNFAATASRLVVIDDDSSGSGSPPPTLPLAGSFRRNGGTRDAPLELVEPAANNASSSLSSPSSINVSGLEVIAAAEYKLAMEAARRATAARRLATPTRPSVPQATAQVAEPVRLNRDDRGATVQERRGPAATIGSQPGAASNATTVARKARKARLRRDRATAEAAAMVPLAFASRAAAPTPAASAPRSGYTQLMSPIFETIKNMLGGLSNDHVPAVAMDAQPTAGAAAAGPASHPRALAMSASMVEDGLEEAAAVDLEAVNEDEEEVYYGKFKTKVVGISYYDGIVSVSEMVTFIREPSNPYDPNAIRVDNTLGIQVGHLPRASAGLLAPIMDGNNALRFEAVVARTQQYSHVLKVGVHGPPAEADRVRAALKIKDKGKMRKKKASAKGASSHTVTEVAGSIFDRIGRQTAERTQVMAVQPLMVATALLPHQRQALKWMMDRETEVHLDNHNTTTNLFWRKSGNLYVNVLTHFRTSRPPAFARGGVLADDMGLGKTITTLSLIALARERYPDLAVNRLAALIVCPLSVVSNWADQIEEHLGPGLDGRRLSVLVYHGPNRVSDAEFLASHDIVITTYNVLSAELLTEEDLKDIAEGRRRARKRKGVLHDVRWGRVVLDEAHIIKAKGTRQARAAFALRKEIGWCLTGTPIVNSVDDYFSLVRFVGVETLSEFTWWKRVISGPVRNMDPKGIENMRVLIEAICLRRVKADKGPDGRPIVDLPPRHERIIEVELGVEERDLYEKLHCGIHSAFEVYERDKRISANWAHVFELILRLRQACLHTDLLPLVRSEGGIVAMINMFMGRAIAATDLDALYSTLDDVDDECCICFEENESPVITACRHVFCKTCVMTLLARSGGKAPCPMCRREISKDKLVERRSPPSPGATEGGKGKKKGSSGAPVEEPDEWKSSSKIDALMLELTDPAKAGQKCVVFSQFTRMLDLIEPALSRAGIEFVRLDGQMRREDRTASLETFRADPKCHVLLASLKAACVGINLTCATRVFLFDLWWNKAIEQQAVDRIHRLGQKEPVEVTRFVVNNTIEERIYELQAIKHALEQGVFAKITKEEMTQLRCMMAASLFSRDARKTELIRSLYANAEGVHLTIESSAAGARNALMRGSSSAAAAAPTTTSTS